MKGFAAVALLAGLAVSALPAARPFQHLPAALSVARRGVRGPARIQTRSSLVRRDDEEEEEEEPLAYNVTDAVALSSWVANLENAFYTLALDTFSQEDFVAAGYPEWVRGRVSQIATAQYEYADLWQENYEYYTNSTLPVCEYQFFFDAEKDIELFVEVATVLAQISTSTYTGLIHYFDDADWIEFVNKIFAVKARHAAWWNSAVAKHEAWGSAYETPLKPDQAFSILQDVIVSCDTSALPFTNASGLEAEDVVPGQNVTLEFETDSEEQLYAVFFHGFDSISVPIGEDKTALVPEILQGFSYVVVSTVDEIYYVNTTNTIAGPTYFEVPFTADVENPVFYPSKEEDEAEEAAEDAAEQ